MEKKIGIKLKKLFAILTLIILLQNYGLILGNIAIAVEYEIFDFTASGNSDFIQITQDKQENNQVEETTRRRNFRRK